MRCKVAIGYGRIRYFSTGASAYSSPRPVPGDRLPGLEDATDRVRIVAVRTLCPEVSLEHLL